MQHQKEGLYARLENDTAAHGGLTPSGEHFSGARNESCIQPERPGVDQRVLQPIDWHARARICGSNTVSDRSRENAGSRFACPNAVREDIGTVACKARIATDSDNRRLWTLHVGTSRCLDEEGGFGH